MSSQAIRGRSRVMPRFARVALAAGVCASACGCLGPSGSDHPGYSAFVLAKDAGVPSVEKDKRLVQQIDSNDAIDGKTVPLRSGFADGHAVAYWDFGTVSATALPPMWQFRSRGAGGEPVDFGHPDLIDSIPGDSSYSPIRAVYTVFVTRAYAGQRIASAHALEDAVEIGLLSKPVATGRYLNCPVTFKDAVLELPDSALGASPHTVYYRGQSTSCFALEEVAGVASFELDSKGKLPAPNAYLLRRQNETRVLDEALAHADWNDDGDTTDTNSVFQVDADAPSYSALWHQINVTVPDDYAFGAAQSEADLFTRGAPGIAAIDGKVVDYQDSGLLLNRPILRRSP